MSRASIRLSEAAKAELRRLLKESPIEDPVISLYGESNTFDYDKDVSAGLSLGVTDEVLEGAIRDHVERIAGRVAIELVAIVISRADVSIEFVVEVEGIPMNVPLRDDVHEVLTLDYVSSGYKLLDSKGDDVFEAWIRSNAGALR